MKDIDKKKSRERAEKTVEYTKKITDMLHAEFAEDGATSTIILMQSLLHIASFHPAPITVLEKLINVLGQIKADLEKKS